MDPKTVVFSCLVAIALGIGCVPSGNGVPFQENFIIGGAPESGYGAVVAILYDGGQGCTGTLVNSRFVVTAAHCVDGSSASSMSVFFGNDVTQSGTIIQVTRAVPHPNYSPNTLAADIAVLELANAAPSTIQPIPYSTTSLNNSNVGTQATFVGFGLANVNQDNSAGLKRSVLIPITDINATEIIYSAPGRQTCFGDSGGPAFLTLGGTQRLVGVTSYGDENCAEYGANIRTDAFASFLANTIGDNSGTDVTPPTVDTPDNTTPDVDTPGNDSPDTDTPNTPNPSQPAEDQPLEICYEDRCFELPRNQDEAPQPGDGEGPRFNVDSGCTVAPNNTPKPTQYLVFLVLGACIAIQRRRR